MLKISMALTIQRERSPVTIKLRSVISKQQGAAEQTFSSLLFKLYFSNAHQLQKSTKHLLDETEYNIRFVLTGQVILGEQCFIIPKVYPFKPVQFSAAFFFGMCILLTHSSEKQKVFETFERSKFC